MGISCGIEEKTEAHFCERQPGVQLLSVRQTLLRAGPQENLPSPWGSPCRSPLSPEVLAVLGLNPRPIGF